MPGSALRERELRRLAELRLQRGEIAPRRELAARHRRRRGSSSGDAAGSRSPSQHRRRASARRLRAARNRASAVAAKRFAAPPASRLALFAVLREIAVTCSGSGNRCLRIAFGSALNVERDLVADQPRHQPVEARGVELVQQMQRHGHRHAVERDGRARSGICSCSSMPSACERVRELRFGDIRRRCRIRYSRVRYSSFGFARFGLVAATSRTPRRCRCPAGSSAS